MRNILLIVILCVCSSSNAVGQHSTKHKKFTKMDLQIKEALEMVNPFSLIDFHEDSLKAFEKRHPEEMKRYHDALYKKQSSNLHVGSQFTYNKDEVEKKERIEKKALREDFIKIAIFGMLYIGIALLFLISNKLSRQYKIIPLGFRRVLFLLSIATSIVFGLYGYLIVLDTQESYYSLRDVYSSLVFSNSWLVRFFTSFIVGFVIFWAGIGIGLWVYRGFGKNKTISLIYLAVFCGNLCYGQSTQKEVGNNLFVTFPNPPKYSLIKGTSSYTAKTDDCIFMVTIVYNAIPDYSEFIQLPTEQQGELEQILLQSVLKGKLQYTDNNIEGGNLKIGKYPGKEVVYSAINPASGERGSRYSTMLLVKDKLYSFDCWYLTSNGNTKERLSFFKSIKVN